ncbi:hypothetical protein GJ496_006331 [Pomphorhynchus laevis]|nr:hypothetical protein GJ496_006331 [Pomphorhynchus laevis]
MRLFAFLNHPILLPLFCLITEKIVADDSNSMAVTTESPDINFNEYNNILDRYRLVLLYFYADWCRFTSLVTPIFNQFANQLNSELNPEERNQVFVGRVNYENNKQKCKDLSISKFPTFKIYRYGQMAFEEYRGERSVEAFVNYTKTQLRYSITELKLNDNVFDLTKQNHFIIGKLQNKDSKSYTEFEKAAFILRDDCDFFLTNELSFGESTLPEAIFYGDKKRMSLTHFDGGFENLAANIKPYCIPLVKKLTLENAEGFTDLQRPLLVLFENPKIKNTNAREDFEKVIDVPELKPYQDRFTYLYASGEEFAHPLRHLGKTMDDLPIVVLDSLRHMYVYPGEIRNHTAMKIFFDRFFDGILHRELHATEKPIQMIFFKSVYFNLDELMLNPSGNIPQPQKVVPQDDNSNTKKEDDAPASMLKLLAPSKQRYTMKDEL